MSPADARVDAVGLLCPLPVLRTEQAARRLAPGSLLEVIADDPQAPRDLRAWCEGNGHELLSVERDASARPRPRFTLRLRLKA